LISFISSLLKVFDYSIMKLGGPREFGIGVTERCYKKLF